MRDPLTKIMNPHALADYSSVLADAVAAMLDEGKFPVVLGGDCSIVLGAMLALRRRGRYGLLYIDGDADFYQPKVNPLRGAASASDLAFATGRGPDVVCDIEKRRPLVRDDDVAVFACRDAADRAGAAVGRDSARPGKSSVCQPPSPLEPPVPRWAQVTLALPSGHALPGGRFKTC